MPLPEVRIVPAPSGCTVFVQPPADTAVRNRLGYMGYVLEAIDASNVPEGFKGVLVRSADGAQPNVAELAKLLQIESYWRVRVE